MAGDTPTTLTDAVDLVAVVIGGPDTLVAAARQVVRGLDAGVIAAPMSDAASMVAEHRPFAIVISTDLYALDQPEFDALAQAVGATLISLKTHGHPERIAEEMTPLLVAASRAHALR